MHITPNSKELLSWLKQPNKSRREEGLVQYAAELVHLMSELRVSERWADTRHGEYWSVYAHPWQREDKEGADILVHILEPSSFEAASSIAAGLRMMLRAEDGPFRLGGCTVNRYGQMWFKGVPPGRYSAVLDKIQLSERTDSKLIAAVAAGLPKEDCLVFHPEDAPITVHMERSSKTGQAVLTFSTQASALADAMVRFTIGGESSKIVFAPTGIEGLWEAVCESEQPFSSTVKCVPQFTVIPKGTGPSK